MADQDPLLSHVSLQKMAKNGGFKPWSLNFASSLKYLILRAFALALIGQIIKPLNREQLAAGVFVLCLAPHRHERPSATGISLIFYDHFTPFRDRKIKILIGVAWVAGEAWSLCCFLLRNRAINPLMGFVCSWCRYPSSFLQADVHSQIGGFLPSNSTFYYKPIAQSCGNISKVGFNWISLVWMISQDIFT